MGGNQSSSLPDHYRALQVSKSATSTEVKRAFHQLALHYHPDKGGDPEAFRLMSEAWQILGDPEKRAVYDAGLKGGLGIDGVSVDDVDPQQLLERFFGNTKRERKVKLTDLVFDVPVTDMQLKGGGTMKGYQIIHQVIDQDAVAAHIRCVQSCRVCQGEGYLWKENKTASGRNCMKVKCDTCTFRNTSKKQRELWEVPVQPGSVDGARVVMKGFGDEAYRAETGDLVFILRRSGQNSPGTTFEVAGHAQFSLAMPTTNSVRAPRQRSLSGTRVRGGMNSGQDGVQMDARVLHAQPPCTDVPWYRSIMLSDLIPIHQSQLPNEIMPAPLPSETHFGGQSQIDRHHM